MCTHIARPQHAGLCCNSNIEPRGFQPTVNVSLWLMLWLLVAVQGVPVPNICAQGGFTRQRLQWQHGVTAQQLDSRHLRLILYAGR